MFETGYRLNWIIFTNTKLSWVIHEYSGYTLKYRCLVQTVVCLESSEKMCQ
jgi:hypothetical protein